MSGWRCGRTYCKLCGELHVHSVEREDKSGYPVMVRCRGCGGVWGPWPSAAEFRERAVLRFWYSRMYARLCSLVSRQWTQQ